MIKSIIAWFTRPFQKESTMTEVIDTQDAGALTAVADTTVQPVAPVAAPVAVVATPVDTDTLKAILHALGHDLTAVWDDAIALAKKAL